MKIVTRDQMLQVDSQAIKKFGIPAIILMENAGIASARCVLQMLKENKNNVIIFCGPGNNGGDGFVCARHLINRGVKVKVYFVGKVEKLSPEAKINYRILHKMQVTILEPKLTLVEKDLNSADLIVDALLGIGLKNEVRQPLYSLIALINNAQKPVLSLDIPSGLDASSGEVLGIAIKAKRTVTFGLFKRGFLHPQAEEYIGEVTVADISLPRQLLF